MSSSIKITSTQDEHLAGFNLSTYTITLINRLRCFTILKALNFIPTPVTDLAFLGEIKFSTLYIGISYNQCY